MGRRPRLPGATSAWGANIWLLVVLRRGAHSEVVERRAGKAARCQRNSRAADNNPSEKEFSVLRPGKSGSMAEGSVAATPPRFVFTDGPRSPLEGTFRWLRDRTAALTKRRSRRRRTNTRRRRKTTEEGR